MRFVAYLLCSILCACGTTVRDSARNAQLADTGTTVVGLSLGAAELNPLGLASVWVKAVAFDAIKDLPEIEQPHAHASLASFGKAATTNNLCVLFVIVSGGSGSVACILIGITAGAISWETESRKAEEEQFNILCSQERSKNPTLTCTFTRNK